MTAQREIDGAKIQGESTHDTPEPGHAEPISNGRTFRSELNEAFARWFPLNKKREQQALYGKVVELVEVIAKTAHHVGFVAGMKEGRELVISQLEEAAKPEVKEREEAEASKTTDTGEGERE